LARVQLCQRPDVAGVLVAPGQVEEQVADRADPQTGQPLGLAGTDAGQTADRSVGCGDGERGGRDGGGHLRRSVSRTGVRYGAGETTANDGRARAAHISRKGQSASSQATPIARGPTYVPTTGPICPPTSSVPGCA